MVLATKSLSWHKHLVSLAAHVAEVMVVRQGRAQPGKREVSRPIQTSGEAAKGRTRIAGLPVLKERRRGGRESSRENNKDGGETHDVQRAGEKLGAWKASCGLSGRGRLGKDGMHEGRLYSRLIKRQEVLPGWV